MKIVVFDLDETLGYFTQYGIFWDSLTNYFKTKNKKGLSQIEFDLILDLYPEFLRPNILNILMYYRNIFLFHNCHLFQEVLSKGLKIYQLANADILREYS